MTLAFLEGPEAIVVIVAVLLVFGANRVPKLARQLGQAQRELKKGMQQGFAGDDPADNVPDGETPSPDMPDSPDFETPETPETPDRGAPQAPTALRPPLPPPSA